MNYLCVFCQDYISPLSSPVMFLKHLMCEKICFPCKARDGDGGDPSTKQARIFRKDCAYENCAQCKQFETSDASVFSCPTLFDDSIVYRWKEYQQHTLDNQHTIKELRIKASDVAGFRANLSEMMTKFKKHYFTYKWLNLCRNIDIERIDGSTIYIQTDYSAQPVLDSQDKLNSQGHGVCVLSCWVITYFIF